MKNVTLAIPDDLLVKAREYAKNHGTTLNEMIRDLLQKRVSPEEQNFIEKLEEFRKELKIDTKVKYSRNELYER